MQNQTPAMRNTILCFVIFMERIVAPNLSHISCHISKMMPGLAPVRQTPEDLVLGQGRRPRDRCLRYGCRDATDCRTVRCYPTSQHVPHADHVLQGAAQRLQPTSSAPTRAPQGELAGLQGESLLMVKSPSCTPQNTGSAEKF